MKRIILFMLLFTISIMAQTTYTHTLMDSTNSYVGTTYKYFSIEGWKYATISTNFDDSTSMFIYGSIEDTPSSFVDETNGDWGSLNTAVLGADSVIGTNALYHITDALFPLKWVLVKYNKWGTINSQVSKYMKGK